MKIRILDDQVRLRLDRGEVERIGRSQPVEGCTRFPAGGRFRYRLAVLTETGAALDARCADDCIEVRVPAAHARQWAETESEVGIAAVLTVDDGTLRVLIEKDFECLQPRPGESQANRFRNPQAAG